MKIGDKVPIRVGTIVNVYEFPDLLLKYYAVKIYEPWSKKWDIVCVEENVLKKLMEPELIDDDVVSTTHIGDYDEDLTHR
jgi:hypothetical protein